MTALSLPEPIAAYFAAGQQNAQALVQCFTAQAVVKDERRIHEGREAIAAWKAQASAQYSYTVDPFEFHVEDGHPVVRCHVAGNFPGSPVDLRYHFQLERSLIASLEITA